MPHPRDKKSIIPPDLRMIGKGCPDEGGAGWCQQHRSHHLTFGTPPRRGGEFTRIIFFLLLCLTSILHAQSTNEEVYTQQALLIAEPIVKNTKIQKLDGLLTHEIKAKILTDSSVTTTKLEFYLEKIEFKRLEKGKFARFLQGSVNLVDTAEHPNEWTYLDTLSGKDLSRVRKTKIESLKGKNPKVVSKVVVPLVAIVASVGAIFALFYVRTQ